MEADCGGRSEGQCGGSGLLMGVAGLLSIDCEVFVIWSTGSEFEFGRDLKLVYGVFEFV